MKQKILELRSEGKTYAQIVRILGCSKGTISYHLGEGVKRRALNRQACARRLFIRDLKLYFGGACQICGYDRCLAALDFHHKDPSAKSFGITTERAKRTKKEITAETRKCLLICSNCHRQIHTKDTLFEQENSWKYMDYVI
jgi:hypothetical protein